MLHDGLERQPGLLGRGDDLGGGQQEAVAPGVTELERVGVLDALVVGPVDGASAGSVWGRTGRAKVRRFETFPWAGLMGRSPEPLQG